MRIAITGSPLAGKTTLAQTISRIFKIEVFKTDDLKDLDWSAGSEEASKWFDRPGDWIIEGIVVPRALRKWQAKNPDKPPPLDWFIYMPNPRFTLPLPGQETLRKQINGIAFTQREWIGERWIEL